LIYTDAVRHEAVLTSRPVAPCPLARKRPIHTTAEPASHAQP